MEGVTKWQNVTFSLHLSFMYAPIIQRFYFETYLFPLYTLVF